MIFRNLFKPKFQDPNPQVRLKAIASLSPDQAEQKTQLHELAFNDEDVNVNLAALKKLNSFALWCKTAETAKSERVKKKAQTMVENALFDNSDLTISDSERKQFIKECKSISLLEKTLKLDWLLNDESGLLLHVLDKIGKTQITKHVLLTSSSEHVQRQLLSKIEDINLLNKIQKKTRFDSIRNHVQLKLEEIELAKTKPVEIEKRARMALSQMLTLKDNTDLDHIQTNLSALTKEFERVSEEFDCLRGEVRENLKERFEQISSQVDRQIKNISPQWESKKQRLNVERKLSTIEDSVKECIQQVNAVFETNVNSITLRDVEQFENRLESLQMELDSVRGDMAFNEGAIGSDSFQNRIEHSASQTIMCRTTLAKLPEFQHGLSSARALIHDFGQLEKPSDFSQIDASKSYLKEQRGQWKALKEPFVANWPSELQQQWSALVNDWKCSIESLQSQLKQNEAKCRSKLKAIEGMIQQGKFKAAIGLFSKVQKGFESLPEKSQVSLSRSFTKVTEQIENLKDWQAYIAQPRKPAVLDEAEKLLEQSLTIEQQAKEIKRLRSQWNSLGNVDTEADAALNMAFDEAIERAFAPCRDHYAEQEKQRNNNADAKLAILEQLHVLDIENTPDETLANLYVDVQKRWKAIGKIDYKRVDEFNQKYRSAIHPLKDKVFSFYKDNAEEKQRLIDKLVRLIDENDSIEAAEQAKLLQKAWKQVSYAGDKVDRRLWNEFRKLNDTIFDKRQSMKTVANQRFNEQKQQFENALNSLFEKLSSATKAVEVEGIETDLAALLSGSDGSEPNVTRGFGKRIDSLQKNVESKKHQLIQQVYKDELDKVFQILEDSVDSEWTAEQIDELPKRWKSAFTSEQLPAESRLDLNILLDISCDKASPESELVRRQEIQLQRLGDKFDGANNQTAEDILHKWIRHGRVLKSEKLLLDRLKFSLSERG